MIAGGLLVLEHRETPVLIEQVLDFKSSPGRERGWFWRIPLMEVSDHLPSSVNVGGAKVWRSPVRQRGGREY